MLAPTYRHPAPVRRSRSGRRRAIVLAIVQLAMIVHIAWWALARRYGWPGATTTTPIEPSESMEFVKNGVVNAGLVFFALALLSTLIFGRWFCGWGCHLVLLQDLCAWCMKKLGIRPRAFRSRLLIFVPLLLALYMFVWPAVYRWGHLAAERMGWVEATLPAWELQWHLTTTEFWRTFPGVLVAIPFLGICGFATVYFLGSKGFCTYGCPYGGFFAPLDRVSPARIRVTDACEHCGHCTAVCTSNVRVHEEVRSYGMVVDPGCMKCLDCVSVCPNDALYFGFGRPALGSTPRAEPERRHYDLTWREEIALALVFLGSFMAVRGVYGLVPMLMAAGVAGCVTFIAWKLWQLIRQQNVSFNRSRLKFRGRLTRRGGLFAAMAILTVLVTIHSGVVRGAYAAATRVDDRIAVGRDAVLGDPAYEPSPALARRAARGLHLYRMASGFTRGGIGFPAPWQSSIDMRRAWLHAVRGELGDAEAILETSLADALSGAVADREGSIDRFASNLGDVIRARGDEERAGRLYREIAVAHQDVPRTLEAYVSWAASNGAIEAALEVCGIRRERFPDDLDTMRWTALLSLETGRLEEGLAIMREIVDREPGNVDARRTLALALAQAQRFEEALETVQSALAIDADRPDLHLIAARLLVQLGRPDIAGRAVDRAEQLGASNPQVRDEIARIRAVLRAAGQGP